MNFRLYNDPTTGVVSDNKIILYIDHNDQIWTVPRGHRIWTEIYEPWLAAGNSPLPA